MFQLAYEFQPNDIAFYLNAEDQSITECLVCQLSVDLYIDEDDMLVEQKVYLVLLNGDIGTTKTQESDLYVTAADAAQALLDVLTPMPPNPTVPIIPPNPTTSI